MLPPSTMRFSLCRDIADGLAPFVAQEQSFNAWRTAQDQGVRLHLGLFIIVLEAYDAMSGTISLYDFEPGGCVRGMPTHYYQKEECVAAFDEAYRAVASSHNKKDVAISREALFKCIYEVLAQPRIDAHLDQYFAELKKSAAAIEEKFIARLGKGAAANIPGLFRLELETFDAQMRPAAALSPEVITLVDQFFREIYSACLKRRDAPAQRASPLILNFPIK